MIGTVWLITTAGVLGPCVVRLQLREDGPTNLEPMRFETRAAGRCTGVRVVIPALGIDNIGSNDAARAFGAGDVLQVPPGWLTVPTP